MLEEETSLNIIQMSKLDTIMHIAKHRQNINQRYGNLHIVLMDKRESREDLQWFRGMRNYSSTHEINTRELEKDKPLQRLRNLPLYLGHN